MSHSIFLSTIGRALSWARANSLWYVTTGSGCCANEWIQTEASRYDLERFGCLPQVDPRQADLLIVLGAVNEKSAPHLRALYDEMISPKYVMAIGSCACTGGAFAPGLGEGVIAGTHNVIPVDVFVPGCPPRPEGIMNGLIALREKICGRRET